MNGTTTDIFWVVVGIGVQTATFLGSLGVVIYKLGRTVEKFEAIGKQQAVEIRELKESVKIIGEVVTRMALTTLRQDNMEGRQDRMEKQLDELRRGIGLIKN